ncbi:TPA: hypothetical protein TUU01_000062 [Streptococcus equi subsp. zooepidemicus]|uniref:hypothetical protein n=1 Tax=Streptococcus equi TaxID=1336 RepID=UPI001E4D40EF|nr:hypothetical protein [Streptococcus equi]MCD3467250.1 hypothetical protein [Streptococcus equi subsp. zooepidemicus]HEL0548209.1 hypothetical protein [Streptococcus equi subsp. zooepidemicus]HEL1063065.1 hypothetical protein [Streptococcus equi subsp. zooepidemicus]HEL1157173.1 hypothetical protein [Streptococcus equi subsp. zooepidemicus]HEL1183664.1 hypothetical protein [Streptococcus equi subsp. zooepidemicus]
MAKNEFYRDFSNRKSFNNAPVSADEELVPAVLTKDMKVTLKPMGLDYGNVETWTFPNGQKVPVVFIPNKKGFMDIYMKFFNGEVERYLKHKDEEQSDDLSLDKFLEDIDDEDGEGFDPTGTTENEDKAFVMMVFELLIEELEAQDVNMGKIIRLLADGFQKKEILDQVDLGKGKTQGYAFIEKTQKIALKIYNDKFRD